MVSLPSYYLDTNVISFESYLEHLVAEFIGSLEIIPERMIIIDTANDNDGKPLQISQTLVDILSEHSKICMVLPENEFYFIDDEPD